MQDMSRTEDADPTPQPTAQPSSSSTAGTEIEMTDMSADKNAMDIGSQGERANIVKNPMDNGGAVSENAESSMSDLLTSAENTVSDATSISGNIAGDIAGGVDAGAEAADIAVDAGIAAGAEVAGASMEFLPVVGQVLGTLLMVGGAVFGAVTSSGETDSQDTDEKQIGDDQMAEAKLKTQELQQQAQVAKQQFTGSDVISNLSSVASQGVTSGAF